jgi:putative glycerol kinase 5
MFGQCCFDVGDIKCTMGTGTFIDVNTGKFPHASVAGMHKVLSSQILETKITYILLYCFCCIGLVKPIITNL